MSENRAGVSAREIARFDALAARWWDPDGPMRPLHRMNPARIAWIEERIRRSGTGQRVLDIGCGAGLAAEALAAHGHEVLGIDAAAEAVAAARTHAATRTLAVSYRVGTADDLLAEGMRFPVVTALEVIEHVPDPDGFLAAVSRLIAPGGLLFVSTLNRTPQAYAAAKIGAEYLLRWLPVGTHDWHRFITPQELAAALRRAGLRVADTAGLVFDPLRRRWRIGRDLSVNYIVAAQAG